MTGYLFELVCTVRISTVESSVLHPSLSAYLVSCVTHLNASIDMFDHTPDAKANIQAIMNKHWRNHLRRVAMFIDNFVHLFVLRFIRSR